MQIGRHVRKFQTILTKLLISTWGLILTQFLTLFQLQVKTEEFSPTLTLICCWPKYDSITIFGQHMGNEVYFDLQVKNFQEWCKILINDHFRCFYHIWTFLLKEGSDLQSALQESWWGQGTPAYQVWSKTKEIWVKGGPQTPKNPKTSGRCQTHPPWQRDRAWPPQPGKPKIFNFHQFLSSGWIFENFAKFMVSCCPL